MLTREQQSLKSIPFGRRFHVRLTAWYAGAVFLVLGVMGVVVYRSGVDSELNGLRSRIKFTALALASTLDPATLEGLDGAEDVESADYQELVGRFARLFRNDPGIDSIYVMRPTSRPNELVFVADYTDQGEAAPPGTAYDASEVPVLLEGLDHAVAEREPVADEYGLTLSGYAPIRYQDGRLFGVLGLDMEAERVAAIRRDVLLLTFGLFGLAALLLLGLAVLVSRMVRRPLAHVMGATGAIAAGDFEVRLALRRGDEFGLLGENFNQMAEGLREREFIRDTLGRYVSRDVARAVLASPGMVELGGEQRDVTVLLSDIRGYSTISEDLEPTQVVELLNQYFGAMNAVIDAHKGCVIEYLGDGILVVFGAPNPLAGHATHAVECALAMQRRLAELHAEWERSGIAQIWQARGLESLRVRVGIHTGPVVAGNLGSRDRMKYSVTGDTVNVAARLEQLNKTVGTELLISAATYERLPEGMRAAALDRGSHQVKGRSQEVRVYTFDAAGADGSRTAPPSSAGERVEAAEP